MFVHQAQMEWVGGCDEVAIDETSIDIGLCLKLSGRREAERMVLPVTEYLVLS